MWSTLFWKVLYNILLLLLLLLSSSFKLLNLIQDKMSKMLMHWYTGKYISSSECSEYTFYDYMDALLVLYGVVWCVYYLRQYTSALYFLMKHNCLYPI